MVSFSIRDCYEIVPDKRKKPTNIENRRLTDSTNKLARVNSKLFCRSEANYHRKSKRKRSETSSEYSESESAAESSL